MSKNEVSEEFRPGLQIGTAVRTDVPEEYPADSRNVEDAEFTREETQTQIRMHEEDIIQGLISAADYGADEQQTIDIIREGKLYFRFRIRPLREDEYNQCKKKHTKYVRNRNLGMKMPEDTNNVKYRSELIYQATVEEDRRKLWDNKKVWEALRDKDLQIMNGLDVIEYSLKAGEKDRIIDAIDRLSGYDTGLEEVAKN